MKRVHSLFPFLTLLGACSQDGPWARAFTITRLDETVGGPKAMVQPGDFILENDRIRLGILGARASRGPHTSGASIIDADLQRPDPRFRGGRGLDQLAEVFPTVNLNVQTAVLAPEDAPDPAAGEPAPFGIVKILNDGADGGPAVICTAGPEESFITLLDALWNIAWLGERPYFRMRTDYILAPGDAAVKLRTTAIFRNADGSWPAGADCEDGVEVESEAAEGSEDSLPIVDTALGKGVNGGGLVFGDFYLQGGSVDVFTPGYGFAEDIFVNDLLAEGINTFQSPIATPFIAGTADRVSYAIQPVEGKIFIPMFTASQTVAVAAAVGPNVDFSDPEVSEFDRFAPGSAFHYERWFAIGRGDVGSAVDALREVTGAPSGRVQGYVVESPSGRPVSGARVFAFPVGEDGAVAAQPTLEWTTDVGEDTQLDGSFGGRIAPGRWVLEVYTLGRPDSERVEVQVGAGETVNLTLAAGAAGAVSFRIVDESGLPAPSKLSVFSVDAKNARNPDLGDGFIGGSPVQVLFTANGEGELDLAPGKYRAVASRGIEYEIDESAVFTVRPNQRTRVDLQVVRSVDTAGWISADFHVHGVRSHDSAISTTDRVTTMAAEGVEFFSSTDHDAMTDHGPAIAALGLESWIATAVGLEVTTIELGHFLSFPLVMDSLADAGGAFDWSGLTPQEMIDGLRDLGDPTTGREPVVFVGHPRDGILGYFDQFGLNPYAAETDGAKLEQPLLTLLSQNQLLLTENFSEDFDGMEVLNGKRMEMIRTPTAPEMAAYAADPASMPVAEMLARTIEEQVDLADGTYTLAPDFEGVMDDWFTLLNLGYRYTALGNSDTHGRTDIESGTPRNFVVSPTDDPAFIDPWEVADAVRAHQVVASYGPFIRFYAGDETQGVGSDVKADGPLTLGIEVQSPRWFDVDRVELYENGSLIAEWTGDALDNRDVLNLFAEYEVNPTKDSWYVVVAMGAGSMDPVVTPVEIPPIFLEDVVLGALAGVVDENLLSPAVPIPRAYPIHPYAVTNPIWVDVDGDGTFTPPGLPAWLRAPVPFDPGAAR